METKTITLSEGQTAQIKGKAVPPKRQKVKKYIGLRGESSDPSIVEVSFKGEIKALAKGTASIYVFAQNGVCKQVNVVVE